MSLSPNGIEVEESVPSDKDQLIADLRKEINQLKAQIETYKAEVADLRAKLACDACDGSGRAVSGPCGCHGNGVLGMLTYVRELLFDANCERDQLKAQLRYMLNIFDRGLDVGTIGRKVCDDARAELEKKL